MTTTTDRPGGEPERLDVTRLRLPAGVTPSAEPVPEGMTDEDRAELRQRQEGHRRAWYVKHRPARYADAQLEHLDRAQDSDGRIRTWLDSTSPTLLLVGAVGTGKTHAAYALANHAFDRGMLVVATSVPDILAALRPGGDDGTLVARARTADLLVLDDLAAEKASEWTAEQLSALIDARVREERRQVVTTNATYAELETRLGPRTLSRLTGGAAVAMFTGPDRRRTTW
jgi:DNA replication protein DnaC